MYFYFIYDIFLGHLKQKKNNFKNQFKAGNYVVFLILEIKNKIHISIAQDLSRHTGLLWGFGNWSSTTFKHSVREYK